MKEVYRLGRGAAAETAAPDGLYLTSVSYPNPIFSSLRRAICYNNRPNIRFTSNNKSKLMNWFKKLLPLTYTYWH